MTLMYIKALKLLYPKGNVKCTFQCIWNIQDVPKVDVFKPLYVICYGKLILKIKQGSLLRGH